MFEFAIAGAIFGALVGIFFALILTGVGLAMSLGTGLPKSVSKLIGLIFIVGILSSALFGGFAYLVSYLVST
jgi:hypothetical protein